MYTITREEIHQLTITNIVIRSSNMMAWSHLVRFVSKDDNQIHLGQLVNKTEEVGLAYLDCTVCLSVSFIGYIQRLKKAT